jgi:hypothetical protein
MEEKIEKEKTWDVVYQLTVAKAHFQVRVRSSG